jgi:hypothetical protein
MLERLLLLQDVARGLQELHSRSVVHGDLVRGRPSWCVSLCLLPPCDLL